MRERCARGCRSCTRGRGKRRPEPLYTVDVKANSKKAGSKKVGLKRKNGAGFILDMGSREALEEFRKAADAFTARATRSREAARQVLISEGIITKSGKLTKHYR